MCLCRIEKRFVSNSRCLARGQDLFTLMFVLLQKNDVFLSQLHSMCSSFFGLLNASYENYICSVMA